MFTLLLWCILFVLCWPMALLALIAYPFIWLLLLPFRVIGVAVHGVLEIIYLGITLPFRLLAAPFRIWPLSRVSSVRRRCPASTARLGFISTGKICRCLCAPGRGIPGK